MKLEKAKEILTDQVQTKPIYRNPDLIDALKLGVEAFIRLERQRSGDLSLIKALLPGETPDD